jgi:hypothetical protein
MMHLCAILENISGPSRGTPNSDIPPTPHDVEKTPLITQMKKNTMPLRDGLMRWIWLLMTCTVLRLNRGRGHVLNFYVLH